MLNLTRVNGPKRPTNMDHCASEPVDQQGLRQPESQAQSDFLPYPHRAADIFRGLSA
jgi:hypothetical protein